MTFAQAQPLWGGYMVPPKGCHAPMTLPSPISPLELGQMKTRQTGGGWLGWVT